MVHLTIYGINIDDVINEVAGLNKDILKAIGAKNVLKYFKYSGGIHRVISKYFLRDHANSKNFIEIIKGDNTGRR